MKLLGLCFMAERAGATRYICPTFPFAMQLYCVIGSFPDIDRQLAGYREFINYFDGGCVNDSFEGFELLHRVHLPGQGQVVALLKANGTAELFKHLAPWRTQFGVEMDITPAISDAEVVANHKVLFAEMDA